MIESDARVVAVEGARTWVEASRRSSCGQCSASGSCGGSLFSELFGGRPVRVEVDNPIAAGLGQRVIVGIPERMMMTGSLDLYLLPLLGLLAGAIAGQSLTENAELPAILGGVLGFFVFPWAWRRLKAGRPVATLKPVILRNCSEGLSVGLPGQHEEKP